MAEYRIVRDGWLGYEVQKKVWFWPFWFQGRTNTHRSVEEAEEWAKYDAKMSEQTGAVVKYLGTPE